MTKYTNPVTGRSYGVELEWADIDTRLDISKWGKWDTDERTICNSDGTAFKSSHIGGEAVTIPSPTIADQIYKISGMRNVLKPNLSHRCGVHIHVGVEGLKDNVEAMKQIFRYAVDNAAAIDLLVSPDCYVHEKYEDPETQKAKNSFNRMISSWLRVSPPTERLEDIMAAETPEEFYQAHYPVKKDGTGRLYALGPRYAVNLRSIVKHGTVEFRHFAGSTDLEEIKGMFEYCDMFIDYALNSPDTPLSEWLLPAMREHEWNFPQMQPFDPQAEVIFHRTKVK